MVAKANFSTTRKDREKSKELSSRFLSNLFMPTVDAELVGELYESFDIEKIADDFDRDAQLRQERDDLEAAQEKPEYIEHEVHEFLKLDSTGKDITNGDGENEKIPLKYLNRHTRLSNPLHVMPTLNLSKNRPWDLPGIGTGTGATLTTTSSMMGRDDISIMTMDETSNAYPADDQTYVTLPSIHPGVEVKLSSDEASRYFGKDARGDFFKKYRAMSETRNTFAVRPMTRNDEDVWENIAHLSEEEKKERCSKYRDFNPPENMVVVGLSPDRSRSPSPINVLLSSRRHVPGVSSPGDGFGSPSSPVQKRIIPEGGDEAKEDGDEGGREEQKEEESNREWAADMAVFNRAIGDLDVSLLVGTEHDRGDTLSLGGSNSAYVSRKGGNKYDDDYDDDDEMSAITGQDSQTVLSKVHHRLKDDLELSSLVSFSGVREDDIAADKALSPRQIYLAACIDKGLAPMPSLVMRNAFTTKIDLTHFGIGDAMGCAFAECLSNLPSIESLNLCDNALTDESLYPILKAVMKIKGLQELNLSRNKIDEDASEALAEYLSNPDCPLYKLVLISADVDDGECAAMVACLETNRNLRVLDLSNNLLGSAETIPGAATGGAALADFIMTSGCQLQSLSLAWNTIRAASARRFCAALATNSTLTYLDLSYNGLGSSAGEILGDSIIENRTLQTILLKNNNIGSTACVTLCIGICQNFAIKELSLDENPIGEAGARAVMQVPVLIGNRVKLSAVNCNTVMRDDKCWYDQGNPCRNYSLDLSKPFERAIAFSVLQVVASHSTNIIAKASYQEPSAKAGAFASKQELQFEQTVAKDKEIYFDGHQKALLEGLRTLQEAASDEDRGKELFEEADLDHGGDLDREELLIVMQRLGLAENPERMADILSLFDLDGSGVMQKEEFLEMLTHQSREAGQRIKELIEYPVLSIKGTQKKYVPPKEGMLNMTVVDGFTEKSNFSVMTSSDQSNALNMAISMGDSQLVQEAIRSSKIRFSEAETLFRRMYKETGNLAQSVAKLLPQMKSGAEAKQLVSKVTKDDRKLMSQIKQMLGPASKTIFGVPNGYYVLDLAQEYHRTCLSRLFEQNARSVYPRQQGCWLGWGVLGDTSQHGNWSCFRNERFNKEPIEITPERFTPMPQHGVLEFDFCGGASPSVDDVAVADSKFVNVLSNLYLLSTEEDKDDALDQLEAWRMELLYDPAVKLKMNATDAQKKKALRPEGKLAVYECDRKRSQEIGLACDSFYEDLDDRRNQLRESMKREIVSVAFGDEVPVEPEMTPGPPPSRLTSANSTPIVKQRKTIASPLSPVKSSNPASPLGSPLMKQRKSMSDSPASNRDRADSGRGSPLTMPSLHEDDVVTPSKLMMPSEIASPSQNPGELEPISKDPRVLMRLRLQALVEHEEIGEESKAARFVELIEETFNNIWIDCRQLAALVQTLPCGHTKQFDTYGSYACGMVVSMYCRLVDHYNIELVLRELSPEDVACVYCRLGFLNVFNPCKVEGTLEMNMARREERLVAKMLIYLACVEPGNNTPQPFFKWKRDLDATPGFEITAPWATEEGLPQKGNLGITFYSGEGKGLEGCKPAPAVRRALMQFCLVDETLFERRVATLSGDRHAFTGKDVPVLNSAIDLLKSETSRNVFNSYLWKGCLSNKNA
jgi:Ca2+-binding EF-hand superfamily protein/Ran GTPase-activating protein (RanGAP) involved in mRNA processing and transport